MTSGELWVAIVNTVLVSVISVLIAVPIGTGLSCLLLRTNVFGRRFAWIAVISQLAVPLYVFAGGWSAGFGVQGWLTALIPGMASWMLHASNGSIVAVGVIHGLAAIPWVCLIVSLGVVWTHRGQEEVALLEGGERQLLRLVLLPRLRPWITAAAIWCLVPVMTEMVVTNLYQVATVPEQIYLDASRGSIGTWTYIAAIGVCWLPLALVGGTLLFRSRAWHRSIQTVNYFRAPVVDLRWQRVLFSVGTWIVVCLLVASPLANVIVKAGWQPFVDKSGLTRYGWSLSRLVTTAFESVTLFTAEFYWSAVLALLATSCAFLLAIALHCSSRGRWQRRVVSCLALLLIAVPGPLAGMLIITSLNRSGWLGILYDRTLLAPVLAQQFRLFPLAWLLTITISSLIPTKTWQQAALDGMGPVGRLRSVVLPVTWRHWATGCLLLMALSIGELSCSILVLPPGVTTLSMRLFEMLHFGMRHQDSGLCGLLLAGGWLVSLGLWKTLRERKRPVVD